MAEFNNATSDIHPEDWMTIKINMMTTATGMDITDQQRMAGVQKAMELTLELSSYTIQYHQCTNENEFVFGQSVCHATSWATARIRDEDKLIEPITSTLLEVDERTDTDSVPTDHQLSDTLLDQYKVLINNQGLLVEEECILKKSEISEMNKVFSFPSNFQVNFAPFGTPEGITASSTLKNNDADLFIVEKRNNDTLKHLFLMLNMTTHDSTNVDFELIRYFAESAIILTVNAQALLSRVRRNNISKEIYGSEVLQPIKIKDTPKMFDETERVRKLAKSIKKNIEAKQSLLKLNSQSKSTFKKSGGSNTNGNNSSNSKTNSGNSGRSNNFNGSSGSVASGSNTSKSASGSNNRFQKNKK
ncbi:hypothetical protein ACTFIV_007907 [Dictyostelium citrinum]